MARPTIEPVTDANLPEFASFLHRHLNARMSAEEWRAGLGRHWAGERPNYGFLLRDEGSVVGGIGAYYADRQIGDRVEKVCNITSWCVLEPYRQQSMRLAMAVLAQPGYHYTDFSPTAVVAGTLKFLKFQPLDETQVVALNLPWPAVGGLRLLHRADEIEAALEGSALQVYRDHRDFPWLRHLLLGRPGAWCHIVYKRRVFKRLPCAAILHVGDPAVLSDGWRRLSAHLLARGCVTTHVERRMIQRRPWPSALRSGFNAKVYRSDSLRPEQIDYLYSETMALDL